MRNRHHLLGIVLVPATILAGCGGVDGNTGSGVGHESDVALTLSASGSSDTHFQVNAVDQASGSQALTQSIEVKAGDTSRLALSLPAGTYTFSATAFADAAETVEIGRSQTSATVDGHDLIDVKLDARGDGKGGAGLQASAHVAPRIDAVTLTLDGKGNATVQVSAEAKDGGALQFVFSGFGLDGTVSGSSKVTLSAMAAASQSSHSLAIVVSDSEGETASAKLDFSPTASSLFASYTLSINGKVEQAMGGEQGEVSSSGSVSLSACLDAHAECNAKCEAAASASLSGAAAEASCEAACAVTLASCEAK